MRETMEFRVPEENAQQYLGPSVGITLGSGIVRKVIVPTDDPLFQRICDLDRDFRARSNGRHFFFLGWTPHRRYTKAESNAAEVFKLEIKRTFEPPGEVCGTVYDESTACPDCGAGAVQTSDLRLDLRKVPRKVDIARTIAGEIVVSQGFAEWVADNGFRGFDFRPVRHKAQYEDDPIDLQQLTTGREILQKAEAAGTPHPTGSFYVWLNRPENRRLYEVAQNEHAQLKRRATRASGRSPPVWHQLGAVSSVGIVPPTSIGVSPSDDDAKGEYRCRRGDTIGLGLISELWVSREDFEACQCDIAFTRQNAGTRRGLLRPRPMLLISPRLWRALEESGLKGFRVEVAHLK